MKIYLSGGMHSNWRAQIKDSVKGVIWIDPTEHKLNDYEEYTTWDLLGVRQCDVLFAYMSADNPSGFGLMLEVGYAKALNKTIIFVDEKNSEYMAIGRATADNVYRSLADGVVMLLALVRLG